MVEADDGGRWNLVEEMSNEDWMGLINCVLVTMMA